MELARRCGGEMTSNIITARSRLYEIIKAKSFSLGSFKLASGRESNVYFNLKPTMFDPEGSARLCELILHRLHPLDVDYVGGLEMGAVPLISPLNKATWDLGLRPIPGFFVRKRPKDHGTARLIEGVDDVRGKRVVVLDDVTTTGSSAMQAVTALQDAGAQVVLVLSVVDRLEGASQLYAEAGIQFQSIFTVRDFLTQ
jgi:orotate phosphoribosyltransferase